MNKYSKLAPLVALTFLGASCSDSAPPETTPPPENGEIASVCDEATDVDCIEVASGALILDESDDTRNGLTGFTLVDDHTIEVGGITRLAPGVPFMRGVRGHGLLLGRITAAEDLGNGKKRFTFERARIQDVIPKARLRRKQHVSCVEAAGNSEQLDCTSTERNPGPKWGTPGWRMTQPPAPLAIESREAALGVSNCRRTWLNDAGNLELSLTACHFTVDFDVDIDVSWGRILPDGFSTSVTMEQDAGLTLTGHFEDGYSAGGPDEDVTVANLGNIPFTVAGIPMYISGRIKAGYALDVHAEADFEAGFEYDGTDVFGFGWNKGDGVYKIRDVARSHTVIGPTWSVAGDVEARAYIRPEIEAGIGFDNVLSAGATLSVELGGRLDGSVYADNDEAEACLSVELYATPTLGYDLDVILVVDKHGWFELADYSVPLYDTCLGTEEMSDPACDTGRCDSDADCVFTAGAAVEGAPEGIVLGPKAGACVTGECDRNGSACACKLTWTPNCCVVDEHCGDGGVCIEGVNRCVQLDVTAVAENGRDLGLESPVFACDDAKVCDDERPLTTDSCVDGDCVHTFSGGMKPAGFQCAQDSDCDSGSFCAGSICLSQRITACNVITCNDGNPRTVDSCADGECSHRNITLLTGPTP